MEHKFVLKQCALADFSDVDEFGLDVVAHRGPEKRFITAIGFAESRTATGFPLLTEMLFRKE